MHVSTKVKELGFRYSGNFCLWNPQSLALKSRIQLKKSGIPQKIGIQDQFPLTKTGIHGVESRIQDCLEFPFKGRNVPAILALTGSSLFFYRGCSVLCSCGRSKFIKNHKLRGANINVILRHYRDVNHYLFFFLFQLVHL